jgi:hypothetical protein
MGLVKTFDLSKFTEKLEKKIENRIASLKAQKSSLSEKFDQIAAKRDTKKKTKVSLSVGEQLVKINEEIDKTGAAALAATALLTKLKTANEEKNELKREILVREIDLDFFIPTLLEKMTAADNAENTRDRKVEHIEDLKWRLEENKPAKEYSRECLYCGVSFVTDSPFIRLCETHRGLSV